MDCFKVKVFPESKWLSENPYSLPLLRNNLDKLTNLEYNHSEGAIKMLMYYPKKK